MHASFPYDGGRSSGGGSGGGGGGRGVEYGAVRRPDALLPPPGLDQTDLVLHTSLVDDPQVSDDVRLLPSCTRIRARARACVIFSYTNSFIHSFNLSYAYDCYDYIIFLSILQNTNVDDGGFMNDLPLLKSEY